MSQKCRCAKCFWGVFLNDKDTRTSAKAVSIREKIKSDSDPLRVSWASGRRSHRNTDDKQTTPWPWRRSSVAEVIDSQPDQKKKKWILCKIPINKYADRLHPAFLHHDVFLASPSYSCFSCRPLLIFLYIVIYLLFLFYIFKFGLLDQPPAALKE